MNFRQLEYLVALSREQHFGRAAAACHVSQPALSSAIARLEQDLDVSLINRGRSFEGMTSEGERVVRWAQRVMAEQDALVSEIQSLRSGVTGVLRLGVVPSATTTSALPIDAFCSAHPLARVKITTALSSSEIHRRLRSFELDAGITYLGADGAEDLDVSALYEERYFLVATAGLLPATATTISWTEASQMPLALLSGEMHSRQIIDQAFAINGCSALPRVESESVASLYAHVQRGTWATIVPHSWIKSLSLPSGAKCLELIDPTATAKIAVAIHGVEPGSVIARAFANTATSLGLGELFDALLPHHTQPASPAR